MNRSLNNSVSDLSNSISALLPHELQAYVSVLVSLISEAIVKQHLSPLPIEEETIKLILNSLKGHSTSNANILAAFGENNNFGDITIGDIAGGNIIKVNISLEGIVTKRSFASSNTINIKHSLKILDIHRKRLSKLEEQATFYGIVCPPHIAMEIEEINKKIATIIDDIGL